MTNRVIIPVGQTDNRRRPTTAQAGPVALPSGGRLTVGQRRRLLTLLVRLDDYRRRQERAHDSRAFFSYAYQLLTQRIIQVLDHSERFHNPEWIVRLDEAFADRYFRALDGYDALLAAQEGDSVRQAGRDMTDFKAWLTTFNLLGLCPEQSEQLPNLPARQKQWRRASVLESLVYCMITHITYDLAFALSEVRLADQAGQSFIDDFHQMNDVLKEAIDEIQEAVSRRYNPWLRFFDNILGNRFDEHVTNYLLRITRGMAWYNAERLHNGNPQIRQKTADALQASMERTIHFLHNPRNRLLRLLLMGMRWLLVNTHRWPRDTGLGSFWRRCVPPGQVRAP